MAALFAALLTMSTTRAVHSSRMPALTDSVLWQGGGVTLYANYSYSASFRGNGQE